MLSVIDSKNLVLSVIGTPPSPPSYIQDRDLMKLAEKVPPATMQQIAIGFMGIKMDEVRMATQKWRESVVLANYEILETWRSRNTGPHARNKLYRCFQYASREGLVDDEVIAFLVENQSPLSGK